MGQSAARPVCNSADTTNLKFGHLEIKGGCQVTVIKRLGKSMCLEVKSAQVEHQYKATFYKHTVQGQSALTFCFQENDKYYIPEVKDKTLTVSAYDDEFILKNSITISNYFRWTKGDDGDWRKAQSLEAPSMYLGLDEEKRIILFNPDRMDGKKVTCFLFKEKLT